MAMLRALRPGLKRVGALLRLGRRATLDASAGEAVVDPAYTPADGGVLVVQIS